MRMFEHGRVQMSDLDELSKKAKEFGVEFDIEIFPDKVEMRVSPWYPTKVLTDTEVKPIRIGDVE